MSETTSGLNNDDIPEGAVDTPISGTEDKSEDVYQTIADSANESHQQLINDSQLTEKEARDLESITVDDVFEDTIDGMEMSLARGGKHVIFNIKLGLPTPKKIDQSDVTYVVEMSSKNMRAAQEKISKVVSSRNVFETKFSSLAVPNIIKGFDNKKTMKSFIKYLKNVSEKLVDIGDIIQDNIKLLTDVERTSGENSSWLYSNRHEWDDENKSEIASMAIIGSNCRSAILELDAELKDVRNQMKAIRVRSTSAGEDLTELIEDYLNDSFDVTKAKNAIKNNNVIAKLNTQHNNNITTLINNQKASDKKKFDEFAARIKAANDAHALEVKEIRDGHVIEMTKQREEFEKRLEDQALAFSKVLDTANKLHKEEVAALHVFYEDKIATVVAGYEKTINELKIVISNYSKKLDEANRLIASYYTALDDSQKNQANLLKDYKELAADRVNKIDNSLSQQKIESLDTSGAPKATEATLSGTLGLNAALGSQREQATIKADQAKKEAEEEDKKEQDKLLMILGGAGLLTFGTMGVYLLTKKSSPKGTGDLRHGSRDRVTLDKNLSIEQRKEKDN